MTARNSAIVSGASSGLGRAIALRFVQAGVDVVGLGRSERGLAETAELCDDAEADFHSFTAEASDEEAIAAAVALPSTLMHCVVNAGIVDQGPFLSTQTDQLRAIMEVNVVGSFVLMRAAAARMASEGGGHIAVIASVLATKGRAGRVGYVASKHGLLGVARTLGAELADDGVRVTTVFPASISTPMSTSKNPAMDPAEVADIIVSSLLASSSTVAVTELHLEPTSHRR